MCTYEPATNFAFAPLVTIPLLSLELDAGAVKFSLATGCQLGEFGELEERIDDVVEPALNPLFGDEGAGCCDQMLVL